EGLALVSVTHREWADDPEPGHAGENLRSAERGAEPVLHPGIGRRSAAGGSVHPRTAAVPAATGLGTVAVHSEEAAGDQRSRACAPAEPPPYRQSGAAPATCAGEWQRDGPYGDGPFERVDE